MNENKFGPGSFENVNPENTTEKEKLETEIKNLEARGDSLSEEGKEALEKAR